MNNPFNISTDNNNLFNMYFHPKCSDVGTSKLDHFVIHGFLYLEGSSEDLSLKCQKL